MQTSCAGLHTKHVRCLQVALPFVALQCGKGINILHWSPQKNVYTYYDYIIIIYDVFLICDMFQDVSRFFLLELYTSLFRGTFWEL